MKVSSVSPSQIDFFFERIDYDFYNISLHLKCIDINLCWKDDSSLLMVAARKGYVMTVHNCIELGADVNASSNSGNTALMEAARNNHIRLIKILLQNGADITAKDQDGFTAWKLAVSLNHKEEAAMLDKNGLEVMTIARNKAAARQYKTQQYSAVVCVLLVIVLSCAYLLMPTATAAVALPSPSLHTTLQNSTTMPTNVTATTNNSVTWLGKHLTTQGIAADLIALCEDKLVRQEGFGSKRVLTSVPTDNFTHTYLSGLGIAGLGVQQTLVNLHRQCMEEEYYADFSTKGNMFWDVPTTIEDAYYSDVMFSTSAAITEPTTNTNTIPSTSTNTTANSPTAANTTTITTNSSSIDDATTTNTTTATTNTTTATTNSTTATTNSTTATTNSTTATSPTTTITWTLPDNTTITVTTLTPHTPKSEEELENKVYGIIFCMIMFVVIICCTRTVK